MNWMGKLTDNVSSLPAAAFIPNRG